uniref:Uncharacterized protein n=1 Tax=Euplotes crassus TaxID=5936 RepID=A0A7S3P1V9_EUPCR|mmetsp:Transcript_8663/g.8185  ORF Transcript_8663/g.8185 Transcript_8663/m.8185 type:complete len:223 (+) Transcript_8663:294-962(+)
MKNSKSTVMTTLIKMKSKIKEKVGQNLPPIYRREEQEEQKKKLGDNGIGNRDIKKSTERKQNLKNNKASKMFYKEPSKKKQPLGRELNNFNFEKVTSEGNTKSSRKNLKSTGSRKFREESKTSMEENIKSRSSKKSQLMISPQNSQKSKKIPHNASPPKVNESLQDSEIQSGYDEFDDDIEGQDKQSSQSKTKSKKIADDHSDPLNISIDEEILSDYDDDFE